MVFRFILYTLIAYLALRLIRHFVAALPSANKKSARINRGSRRAGPVNGARSSKLVRCARCGMFVAESSALPVKDAEFCSKACAEAGAVHKA